MSERTKTSYLERPTADNDSCGCGYRIESDREIFYGMGQTIYDHVKASEEERIFNSNPDNVEYLESVKREVQDRIGVTKYEIFKIGELLNEAKKVCQQHKLGFQKWIEENFDFSYETANNFMNVYKYCFAYHRIAVEIPTSILYKISKPSFPEELREYLFAQGNIDKIKNNKTFQQIIEKYKEGGLEAVEEDIEYFREAQYTHKQIDYALDMAKHALHSLYKAKKGIENQGAWGIELDADGFVPTAKEVNGKITDAIDKSIEDMESVYKECENILSSMEEQMKQKCKISISGKITTMNHA